MFHRRIPIITVAALVAALAVPTAASANPFTNAFKKIGASVRTAAQQTGKAINSTAHRAGTSINATAQQAGKSAKSAAQTTGKAVLKASNAPETKKVEPDVRNALSLLGVYMPELPKVPTTKTATTTNTVQKPAMPAGKDGGKVSWEGKLPPAPAPTPTPVPAPAGDGKDHDKLQQAIDKRAQATDAAMNAMSQMHDTSRSVASGMSAQ